MVLVFDVLVRSLWTLRKLGMLVITWSLLGPWICLEILHYLCLSLETAGETACSSFLGGRPLLVTAWSNPPWIALPLLFDQCRGIMSFILIPRFWSCLGDKRAKQWYFTYCLNKDKDSSWLLLNWLLSKCWSSHNSPVLGSIFICKYTYLFGT